MEDCKEKQLQSSKICLLLHGHVRTFEKTHKSLENIDNFLNVDIFIHTWDTLDRLTPSHYENENENKAEAINLDKIKQIYKPKDICVGTQTFKDPNKTCPYNKLSYEGHKYYFESFYKANEMKKKYEKANNFKYDLVIKSRPDVIFKTCLDLKTIDKDTTYLLGNPVNKNVDLHSVSNFRALDVMTICNSRNMDEIANFIHSIDKYTFVKFHKHSGFIDYILDLNINLEILDYIYGRDWGFLRL
jgi:hypothetical protein